MKKYRRWNLTKEEIVKELQSAIAGADNPEDGHTVFELSDLLNMSPGAVRVRLSALKDAGRLEVVTVRRLNLAGKLQARSAYRILPSPDETEE